MDHYIVSINPDSCYLNSMKTLSDFQTIDIVVPSRIWTTAGRWDFLWSRRSTDQATTAGSFQIFYVLFYNADTIPCHKTLIIGNKSWMAKLLLIGLLIPEQFQSQMRILVSYEMEFYTTH